MQGKGHQVRKIILLFAFLLSTGCALASSSLVQDTPTRELATATATVVVGSQPGTSTLSAKTSSPTVRASAASSPVSSPQKTPSPVPLPPLTLQVNAPLDESLVNTSTILVMGTTSANAVVSVNGNLATVDAAGNFQSMVTPEEGPNIIEVVASDVNGNELSVILSVIYQP